MVNELLREHTTSIGFNLTLSKAMIDHLVLIHQLKGDGSKCHSSEHRKATRSWVTTIRCLEERGLITHAKPIYKGTYIVGWTPYKITKAGTLVVNLLKEAGIYQDRVVDLGLEEQEAAA